jgi:hypothetical protein
MRPVIDGHQVLAAGDRVLVDRRDRQAGGREMKFRGVRPELGSSQCDNTDADDRAGEEPPQEDALVS